MPNNKNRQKAVNKSESLHLEEHHHQIIKKLSINISHKIER